MRIHLFFFFTILALSSTPLQAELQEQEISYTDGATEMKGFLVYDSDLKTPRPGILVVHEWWGLNEYARKRARMLAKLGYTALAVDMYGDGKQAEHPKDAGTFARAVMGNLETAKSRFEAALKVLHTHRSTNPETTAAIGYCFGGGIVLHMARAGVPLKGVVSFHGSLATKEPAQKEVIKAKVLVLNGAADKMVSTQSIAAFEDEMTAAGADHRVISYEGARHAFTNPDADRIAAKYGTPIAYNQKADKESWQEMKAFLARIFDR